MMLPEIGCAACKDGTAVDLLDVEWNGEWIAFPVCAECLTRARENDMIR
jgi:hypothetical protein